MTDPFTFECHYSLLDHVKLKMQSWLSFGVSSFTSVQSWLSLGTTHNPSVLPLLSFRTCLSFGTREYFPATLFWVQFNETKPMVPSLGNMHTWGQVFLLYSKAFFIKGRLKIQKVNSTINPISSGRWRRGCTDQWWWEDQLQIGGLAIWTWRVEVAECQWNYSAS